MSSYKYKKSSFFAIVDIILSPPICMFYIISVQNKNLGIKFRFFIIFCLIFNSICVKMTQLMSNNASEAVAI